MHESAYGPSRDIALPHKLGRHWRAADVVTCQVTPLGLKVHGLEIQKFEWLQKHVAFRDHLRRHPADTDAYTALKYELAVQYRNDRTGYALAKTEFVERILARVGEGR